MALCVCRGQCVKFGVEEVVESRASQYLFPPLKEEVFPPFCCRSIFGSKEL